MLLSDAVSVAFRAAFHNALGVVIFFIIVIQRSHDRDLESPIHPAANSTALSYTDECKNILQISQNYIDFKGFQLLRN